jgi:hypothetical protein
LRLDSLRTIGKRWLCRVGAMALTCMAAHGAVAQEAAAPAAKTTIAKSHSSSQRAIAHTRQAGSLHGKRTRKRRTVARGQQKIDPERAQEIQEALIREHYLSSTAAGTWNQASEDAMRRYQADHGWQSKTVPDSRALISLGLGPSHDHLLNPESAMTTGPASLKSASAARVSVPSVSSNTGSSLPANGSASAPATRSGLGDSSGPQK